MNTRELGALLERAYGIRADQLTPMQIGVGGETYRILAGGQRYVCKLAQEDGMNHPRTEPALCGALRERGLPVPEYLPARDGSRVVPLGDGRFCHVQTYLEGAQYRAHAAPSWFLGESARTLGRIHAVLSQLPPLPVGIGQGFLTHMTPRRASAAYESTLRLAQAQRREDLLPDLRFRLALVSAMPDYTLDFSRLTCCNSHGDYTVNQLLCRDHRITGIVDWTCACTHPVIWELTRSYAYAEPACADGAIPADGLARYREAYEELYPLNDYDRAHLVTLYLYQLAVCDYYGQYLRATERNREEYLWQARFATGVLRRNGHLLGVELPGGEG